MTIDILVDGDDYLHLQGNTAWIVHGGWDRPANGVKINDKSWELEWNGNTTRKFTQLAPPFPTAAANPGAITLNLSVIKAGGPVTITQAPTAANNYEAVIHMDDQPNGAHTFVFSLLWTVMPK